MSVINPATRRELNVVEDHIFIREGTVSQLNSEDLELGSGEKEHGLAVWEVVRTTVIFEQQNDGCFLTAHYTHYLREVA